MVQSGSAIDGAPRYWLWNADDLGALARYVSSNALARVRLEATPGSVRQGVDIVEADRRVARERFDALVRRNLDFTLEPWSTYGQQQIRDPQWMFDVGGGRCLDLALLFASMCIESHVAPMLAVDRHHAFVVLRLGVLRDPLGSKFRQPPGTSETSAPHVYEVTDPEQLASGLRRAALLPIECVAATRREHAASFDVAVRRGRERLISGVKLVDVAAAQQAPDGLAPFDAPGGRPAIATFAPVSAPAELYANQRRVMNWLRGRSGTVVVFGPAGRGKSTIAREVIREAPNRAAWFLDASEAGQLESSLADAELAEFARTATELTRATRQEYALGALARLREASDVWTVVLDNADGEPAKLAPLRPRPRNDQLVVITTTNPGWADVADVQFAELEAMSRRDAGKVLGDSRLVPLANGRAVYMDAFARYTRAGGTTEELLAHDPGPAVDWEERGAQALYGAILDAEPSTTTAEVAQAAALLPADHIPRELLARTAVGDAAVADRLVDRGLLGNDEQAALMRMHRLMSRVVRDRAPAATSATARVLAGDDEACDTLDRWADSETILRFADALAGASPAATPSSRRRDGRLLARAAGVLETKGHTARSAEIYARAERDLDASDPDDRDLLARCWLGQARSEYQRRDATERQLERARELALKAERVVEERHGPDAAGRYVAMRGLIEKALALKAPPAQQRRLLKDALKTLRDADRRRTAHPATEPEELLRSKYNLAGIGIDLAQREVSAASRWLNGARTIYTQVERARRDLYQRPVHPHIASCVHGRAIVGYYQALLVDTALPARVSRLREAQRELLEGLQMRMEIAGSDESEDVHKSTELLVKIALARSALPTVEHGRLRQLAAQAHTELELGGLVVDRAGSPRKVSDLRITVLRNSASVDDLEALYSSLHAHHVAIAPRFGGRPPRRAREAWRRRRAQYVAWLDEPRAFIVAAWRGEQAEPVGYAFVAIGGGYNGWQTGDAVGQVKELVVDPDSRDRGIGNALMDAVAAELTTLGIEEIALNVLAANLDAIRFYDRRGLAVVTSTLLGPVARR